MSKPHGGGSAVKDYLILGPSVLIPSNIPNPVSRPAIPINVTTRISVSSARKEALDTEHIGGGL